MRGEHREREGETQRGERERERGAETRKIETDGDKIYMPSLLPLFPFPPRPLTAPLSMILSVRALDLERSMMTLPSTNGRWRRIYRDWLMRQMTFEEN